MEKRSYYMSKSGSGPHALPQQERARDGRRNRTNTPRVEHDLEAVLRHRCPPYLPLSLKDWVRSAAEVNVDLVGLQVHAADEVEVVSSLGGYLE